MDGAGVEWILGVADAQKAGGLLVGFGAQTGNFQHVLTPLESSLVFAEFHDVLCQ